MADMFNRFLGFSGDYVAQKFSRDDEQILALNYENTCDSDYLSRLFVSEGGHSNSAGGGGSSADSSAVAASAAVPSAGAGGASTSLQGESVQSNGGTAASASQNLTQPSQSVVASITPRSITNNLLSNVSSTRGQNSTYLGRVILHDGTMLACEIPEDVSIFSTEHRLAHQFMRKRFMSSEVPTNGEYQDSLAAMIHKQMLVFDYMSSIILSECRDSGAHSKSCYIGDNKSNCISAPSSSSKVLVEIAVGTDDSRPHPSSSSHFVSESLLSMLKAIDKQSRSRIEQTAIEPILALLISLFQQALCQQVSETKRGGGGGGSSFPLSQVHLHYLRSILCNGTAQGINAYTSRPKVPLDNSNFSEIEEGLRLAYCCSFGMLAIAIYARSPSDTILSLTQLMFISSLCDELHEVIAQSESNTDFTNGISIYDSNCPVPSFPSLLSLDNKMRYKVKLLDAKGFGGGGGGSGSKFSSHTKQMLLQSQTPPPMNNKLLPNDLLTSVEDSRDFSDNSDSEKATSKASSSSHNAAANGKAVIKDKKIGNREKLSGKLNFGKGSSKYDQDDAVPGTGTPPIVVNRVTIAGKSAVPSSVGNSNTSLKQGKDLAAAKNNGNLKISDPGDPSSFLSTPPSPMSKNSRSGREKDLRARLSSLSRIPKSVVRIIRDCGSVVSASAAKNSSNHIINAYDTTYVWSSGQNSYGELGHGDINQRRSFSKISFLEGKCVTSIGAGNEHSIFVTQSGKMFVCGYNDNGQCGVGSLQQVRTPTAVSALDGEDIAQVNVYNGCEHTLAVTRDGKLYSFGYNYRGQLGLGSSSSEVVPRPVKSLLSKRVVLAACSYHHSIMLCSDGVLMACGRNDCGQLGHGDNIDKKSPHPVLNSPKAMVSISCGQFHSIVSTSSGSVFVCGKNDYGQLGLESVDNVKVLSKLVGPEVDNTKEVCCGYYHSLILSHSGTVTGFGRNDYGQLGLGHTQPRVHGIHIINGLRDKNVTSVAAGCYHSVASTLNGMLYVFGRNNHGQLGSGDLEEKHLPHPIDNFVGRRIVSVAAGFYHTLVLAADLTGDALLDDGSTSIVAGAALAYATNSSIGQSNNNSAMGTLSTAEGTSSSLINSSLADAPLDSPPPLRSTRHTNSLTSNKTSNSLNNLSDFTSRMTIGKLLNHVIVHLNVMNTYPAAVTSDSLVQPQVGESWVVRQLSVYSELLCATTASLLDSTGATDDDHRVGSNLPLTTNECINLLRTLFRTIDLFLVREKQNLFVDIDKMGVDDKAEAIDCCSPPGECFQTPSRDPNTRKGTTRGALESLQAIYASSAEMFVSDDINEKGHVMCKLKAIAKLRQELISTYFYLPGTTNVACAPHLSSVNANMCQTICQDCAAVVFKHFDTLLPHTSVRSRIFESMATQLLSIQASRPRELEPTSNLKGLPVDLHRCLRLFSGLCFRFRGIGEVVRLFRSSTKDGLAILHNLLAVYCHISLLSVDTKAQQQAKTPGGDVSKTLAALEHCCTNFLKCAIPLVFASDVNGCGSDDGIRKLGESIIADIFRNAENVFDHLTMQPLTVDLLNVLRTGTVIPSILPTTLLFGMTGAVKNSRSTLFLIPLVGSLISKLNMVGRSDAFATTRTTSSTSIDHLDFQQQQQQQMNTDVPAADNNTVDVSDDNADEIVDPSSIPASTLQNKEMASYESVKIYHQVPWWSRLMKLSTMLQARLAASLVSAYRRSPIDAKTVDSASGLIYLDLFAYLHIATSTESAALMTNPSPDLHTRASDLAAHLRRQSTITDTSYRLMHQMGKTSTQLQALEAAVFSCFLDLSGYSLIPLVVPAVGRLKDKWLDMGWRAVVAFCKRLHSWRSAILNENENSHISWKAILTAVGAAVNDCHVHALSSCVQKVNVAPLPPLVVGRRGTGAKAALRRCVLVVLCMNRWNNALKYRFKSFGDALVDFLHRSVVVSASNLKDICVGGNGIMSIGRVIASSLKSGNDKAANCAFGLSMLRSLLKEQFNVSIRADVMATLLEVIGKTNHHLSPSLNQQSGRSSSLLWLKAPVACEETTKDSLHSAIHELLVVVSSHISSFLSRFESTPGGTSVTPSGGGGVTILELNGLALALKLFNILSIHECASASRYLHPRTLSKLFVAIEGGNGSVGDCSDAVNMDGKSTKVTSRYRLKSVRRVSNAIISLIQELSIASTSRGGPSPYPCDLMQSHVDILNTLHVSDEKASSNGVSGGGSGGSTSTLSNSMGYGEVAFDESPSKVLEGPGGEVLSSPLKSSALQKDGRKRCQELISKPLEFCKSQEGYVLQGDKLLNNYKGIDFTIATWILVTKKTNNKLGFIAGKINHNDAWPIVALRPDRKIDVIYGHGNEFDRISSVVSIPLCVWTHVAIVVEPKRIKVYVNGVLDSQSATKGNARAILYPVVIGTCPLSVRTRVDHVRDGFDGFLSQFKYFTRSLSPIHIQVIFDQGPPEEYDGREMWMYQLLSSIDRLSSRCESSDDNESLVHISSLLMRIIAHRDGRRLRNASIRVLGRILVRGIVRDIKFAAPDGPMNSICSISLLSAYSTFERKLVYYFIMVIGLCKLPSLIHRCESSGISSTDVGGNNNADLSIYSHDGNNNGEVAAGDVNCSPMNSNTLIDQLLLLAPMFLSKKSRRASNTFITIPIESNNSIDSNAIREELSGELSHNLVILLRFLGMNSEAWAEAIADVISDLLSTYCRFLQANPNGSSASAVMDSEWSWCGMLGVCEILGGSQADVYVGSDAINYYGDAICTVLNINKTTNSAYVIAWNTSGSDKVISNVRYSDLSTSPPIADNAAVNSSTHSTFIRPSVLNAVLDVLDVLSTFTRLSLSDALCLYRPDHPFPRNTLLKLTRPMELYLAHHLMKCISTGNDANPAMAGHITDELAMPTRRGLLKNILRSSVRALRSSNASEEIVADRSLNTCWIKAAKYNTKMASSYNWTCSDFPTPDIEKSLTDYIGKYLGVSADTYSGTSHDKLLKHGMFIELLHSVSVGSQSSQHECVNSLLDDGKFTLNACQKQPVAPLSLDISEPDSVSALRLVYQLRKSLINHCRDFLQSHGASLQEKNAFVDLPVSWKVLLFHTLSTESTKNNTFTTLIATQLMRDHSVEVTNSLSSSLRFGAVSFLLPSISKTMGNIIESTDVVSRIVAAASRWVEAASAIRGAVKNTASTAAKLTVNVGTADDNAASNKAVVYEMCFHVLKTLLPSLSFIESTHMELQILQLCQCVLRSICLIMMTPLAEGCDVPGFPKDLFDLAKSNYFTLVRARAQEQLAKQRGSVRVNFSPLSHSLTQIAVYLEILQRKGCLLRFNQHHGVTSSSSTSWLHNLSAVKTGPPRVMGVHTSSVDVDLTPCVTDLPECTESIATPIQFAMDAIIVEVAVGVNSDNGEAIFETIYCGSSLRFIQSGLAPGCSYLLRCRTWYGDRPCLWSQAMSFRTESAMLFAFDPSKCGTDILLSEDGLSASYAGDDCWSTILGTQPFTSGVTSWEIRITQSSTAYLFVGVAASQVDLNTFLGGCQHGWGFIGEQALYHNREKIKVYGEPFSAGDVVGVVLDLNIGVLSFTRNGRSLGVAFDGIYGELYPAVAFYNVGQELEILAETFSSTCSLEPVPASPSQLNIDIISLITEMSLCIHTDSALPRRVVEAVCDHCNGWNADVMVRARATSGRSVFLKAKGPLLADLGLTAGSRVRTSLGIGEVAGEGYGRLWCRNSDKSSDVWFFSQKQVSAGRALGLYLPCTYESSAAASSSSTSSDHVSMNNNNIGDGDCDVDTFDQNAIQDLLEPSKWSSQIDSVLTAFILANAESRGVSPFDVTVSDVCSDFRTIQQQLSRIVMASPSLSHKWGIGGPKRRAVIARIGLLRLLNHHVDHYLPSMMVGDDASTFERDNVLHRGFASSVGKVQSLGDGFSPTATTIRFDDHVDIDYMKKKRRAPILQAAAPCGDCAIDKGFTVATTSRYEPQGTGWVQVGLSVEESVYMSPPLHSRHLIFTELKIAHFWEIVSKSASKAAKTEDDYDYPDDLPQVKVNRIRAYRSREASAILGIPGEDLLWSSIVSQLWCELRKHPVDKLRLSYTHPMDDGQSRAFKIKFDGEGVDDYGGPYREIFQQLCDELQSLAPEPESDSSSGAIGKKATLLSCFLPLLMPTPNWSSAADCAEKYMFMFDPASCSPYRMDLFRFIGQVIGIGIRSKVTLDLSFPSAIWKMLALEALTDRDLASYDQSASDFISLLSGLMYAKAAGEVGAGASPLATSVSPRAVNSPRGSASEELRLLLQDLSWSATRCDGRVVELSPGGAARPVLMHEVHDYIRAYVECRLNENSLMITAVREGLLSIIPENALSLLSWHELERAVCGDRIVDVSRLRANTEYDDDVSAEDQHILFFWEVLSEMTEVEKSAFLRFVWARPTLPPRDVPFPQKFKIQSAVGDDAQASPDAYLPKAHTCFFSINLPRYTNKTVVAEKLRYAIMNCTEMDADFRTVEPDVPSWNSFQ